MLRIRRPVADAQSLAQSLVGVLCTRHAVIKSAWLQTFPISPPEGLQTAGCIPETETDIQGIGTPTSQPCSLLLS